jgi:hypothetical protein
MALPTKQLTGLLIVFTVVTAIAFFLKEKLAEFKVDYLVVLAANLLLFLLSIISIGLHARAVSNPNPQAFIRSIMLANILKVFTVAIVALIYILASKKNTSVNAIFVGLFLYIVYTWLEKRVTLKLNEKKS